MSISYTPLRILLAKKNIGISQLREMIGCSPTTIAKIRKNKPISMEIVEKMCTVLSCKVEDILEITQDEKIS